MTAAFWKKPNVRLWLLLACLLVVWQVSGGSPLFPTPLRILNAVGLESVGHLTATLCRTGKALVLGCALGFLCGVLIDQSRLAERFIGLPAAVLMPVPGLALAPLFIALVGFGDRTIVAVGTLASFFPTCYNTAAGLKAVDREPVEAALLDGAGRLALLHYVKLPLALPYVLNGLRLSIARCWRTVIAVEFIAAASYGLGYRIWDAAEFLRQDVVLGGIAVMVLVYFLVVNVGFGRLERAWLTI